MNNLGPLQPYVSRFVAAFVAFFVTWLAAKGINLDAESQIQLKALLETTIFTIIYAITHRSIDKVVNPGDAASSHLAKSEKGEAEQLKQVELDTKDWAAIQTKGAEKPAPPMD